MFLEQGHFVLLGCLAVGCCPRSQVEPRGAFKLFTITVILLPFNVTCHLLEFIMASFLGPTVNRLEWQLIDIGSH